MLSVDTLKWTLKNSEIVRNNRAAYHLDPPKKTGANVLPDMQEEPDRPLQYKGFAHVTVLSPSSNKAILFGHLIITDYFLGRTSYGISGEGNNFFFFFLYSSLPKRNHWANWKDLYMWNRWQMVWISTQWLQSKFPSLCSVLLVLYFVVSTFLFQSGKNKSNFLVFFSFLSTYF